MQSKILRILSLGIVLVTIFISCNFLSPLAPPEWIIGTWSDECAANNWTFSSDNAVFSTIGASIDFKEYAKSDDVTVTDNSTVSSYSIFIKESGSDAGTYRFDKLADTTLNYSVTIVGVTIGPIVLYKQ